VLSQRITTSMHNTTHIDAPAHVVQGTPFIDEVPLPHFFGSGIVVSIRRRSGSRSPMTISKRAAGKIVRPRDVVHRQHRLAQALRGQRGLFLPLPRFRALGRRMVRRERR